METIAALASGVGRSGVAVVRVSGPQTRFIVETISGQLPKPRMALFSALRDRDGDLIDRGLVLFFPTPNSFTGEDVVEFHVHGSPAVVRRLLQGIIAVGSSIRIAGPGEFTHRAFRNGKLDLTEVEALGLLIDSDTERQARLAQTGFEGSLRRRIEGWSGRILAVLSGLEARIDFSDEGDVSTSLGLGAIDQLRELMSELAGLLEHARGSRRLRDGLSVTIAGPPNSGKSSLMNALTRRNVAIVSDIAGTTRDLVEAVVDVDGWPIRFVDSAGLRATSDPVEAEGIRRAQDSVNGADIVLWLGGPDLVPRPDSIRIRSKCDLVPEQLGGYDVAISVVTGVGLDQLRARICDRARVLVGESDVVVTERQEDELRRCGESLERSLRSGLPEELIAEELYRALAALDRIIGRVGVEDVLGEIFSRFCIGK